ncbi:MAG: MFS transporter [Elusimicrobiaceae bacterium]|jgi:MFS family permease|nr:MFS transporter [Elusimicrobiaceae bacterium]MBT3954917.1 MFS transporter [Elusimicrobiaceae bacterium]MBT4008567.1 MFS transporter [Elusimicrobiaceae bacterium]MBT4402995.1 MFS transporter [Elusimicrobiaceae bacterium]MBT4439733.1 MFS transporter [Elusimicrobiaceae bacterium]
MQTNKISYTKEVWVIAGTNAIIAFGYGLSIPFFTIYLSVEKQLAASLIGLILAFAMGLTAVGNAISGELSDVIGRKKVMLIGLSLTFVFINLIALCIKLNTHYLWVIISYFLACFAMSFFRPSSNAYIADTVAPNKRVQAFGAIRTGLNFGWAIGPAVGGYFALKSYSLTFSITSLFYLTAFFVILTTIPKLKKITKQTKSNFTDTLSCLKDKRFAKFCLSALIIAAGMSQLFVSLPLHATNFLNMPSSYVGLLLSVNGATVVLFQIWMTKFTSKIRITLAMFLGCILFAMGYLTIGFSNFIGSSNVWLFGFTGIFFITALGVMFFSFAETAVLPGTHTLPANIAPEGKKGRYIGMQGMVHQGGIAFGILIGGFMVNYFSVIWTPIPWIVTAIAVFFAGYGILRLKKNLTLKEEGLE